MDMTGAPIVRQIAKRGHWSTAAFSAALCLSDDRDDLTKAEAEKLLDRLDAAIRCATL
jgi:hypothetical protein